MGAHNYKLNNNSDKYVQFKTCTINIHMSKTLAQCDIRGFEKHKNGYFSCFTGFWKWKHQLRNTHDTPE